jgi:hypothetical protein
LGSAGGAPNPTYHCSMPSGSASGGGGPSGGAGGAGEAAGYAVRKTNILFQPRTMAPSQGPLAERRHIAYPQSATNSREGEIVGRE